jgi:WD40 repeat protein
MLTDPTGQWLATSGWDNQAALFDLRDGERILSMPGQIIKAAPDRPAFLLDDGHSWSLLNLEAAYAFQAHRLHDQHLSPRHLAFSRDGRWLASCGQDGVRLLDRSSSRSYRLPTGGMAHRVVFNDDSTQLHALFPDRLRAWSIAVDPLSRELRFDPVPLPMDGRRGFHDADVRETGISADGQQWIAAGTNPRTGQRSWIVGRFDSIDTTFLAPLTKLAGQPDLSPDGRWIAWGGWKVDDAYVARVGEDQPPLTLAIPGSAAVKFSPDGRRLVVGGYREIQVRETGTWRILHVLSRDPPGPLAPLIDFTADSRTCAVGLAPHRLLLLDVETGTELATLPANHYMIQQPAFGPDARTLAAASSDHHVLVWDLARLRSKLAELSLDW